MGAALAGLGLMTSCTQTTETTTSSAAAKIETVMCHGVNSCKAQGSCHGKVDACNGANGGQAELTCAGRNECKGKGLIKLTKEDCKSKGGKVAM